MARVDYYAIELAIQTQLQAASGLTGVTVALEEELPFGMASDQTVEIYLERREAAADLQGLSAGRQTRFRLHLSLWCWGYSLESVAKACQIRDDLMGNVELALLGDHTFAGAVTSSWLEGGQFDTKESPGATSGFSMGGQIILVADVKATT